MIDKFVLGTAQLGIYNYGINNSNKSLPDSKEIFDYLIDNNLKKIDTSIFYGSAPEIIGKYNNKKLLKIYTKIGKSNEIDQFFKYTGLKKIHCCYVHNYSDFKNDKKVYDALEKEKELGRIEKIGFSLYHPFEIEEILANNINVQIIQVPYNIFDRRFEKYFKYLKDQSIQVVTRSCFLQGLFFKENLSFLRDKKIEKTTISKIQRIKNIAKKYNLELATLCYAFNAINKNVDDVIVGNDNLSQLKQNLNNVKSIDSKSFNKILEELLDISESNEKIILPYLWKNNE